VGKRDKLLGICEDAAAWRSVPFGETASDRRLPTNLVSDMPTTPVAYMRRTGEVLAQRDVDLMWTRVGGTEQCGGPATTGPITLSLP
jgi:hypothetical protein